MILFFLNELHVMIKTYALHEMEVLLRTCVVWRSEVSKAAIAILYNILKNAESNSYYITTNECTQLSIAI